MTTLIIAASMSTSSIFGASSKVDVKIPEDMCLIATDGSFVMGHNDQEWTSPARNVYLDSFFLDRYEVTNKKFCEFLNAMGNQKEGGTHWYGEETYPDIQREEEKGRYEVRKGRENYPVCQVTWFGAAAYAKWAGKRLPTEAEWEYAASNGGKTIYPWGNEWFDDYCNWGDGDTLDGFEFVAPVDSFSKGKNIWGCYNLTGNVFEWVNDWGGNYDPSDTTNPKGPLDGGRKMNKIHRGGCYKYPKAWMASYMRLAGPVSAYYPCVGFRCAMDVPKTDCGQQ
jgi:formylglycine-generating enzyme required for sulfatase activity